MDLCTCNYVSWDVKVCVFCPQQRKEQERNREYNEFLSHGTRVSDVQADLLVSLVSACGGHTHLLPPTT